MLRKELVSHGGLRSYIKNKLTKANKEAIFIFGFQKSGTSAIAGLLAESTGKSVTIDTPYFWYPNARKIIDNEISVKSIVEKYCYPFSKDIFKEPNATFFIPQIEQFFYLKKYVFIVRNPFDNIRSILNRLSIPGNLNRINDPKLINSNWLSLFEEYPDQNYIGALANWWMKANNQFNYINSARCVLVRYEDFVENKIQCIENLALQLNLEPMFPIRNADKQFQSKGNNNENLKKFFGQNNYQIIENICGDLMDKYGYS